MYKHFFFVLPLLAIKFINYRFSIKHSDLRYKFINILKKNNNKKNRFPPQNKRENTHKSILNLYTYMHTDIVTLYIYIPTIQT